MIDKLTISDLLNQPFEKHIGTFEVPMDIKNNIDIDTINAIITWYLKWKIYEPVINQDTCRLKDIFGNEKDTVIVSINLWKYLRGHKYDPNVIQRLN